MLLSSLSSPEDPEPEERDDDQKQLHRRILRTVRNLFKVPDFTTYPHA